ncbi:MAG: hypothetical protein JNJ61_17300, partial [Anaerolineae bacterium]|nr:hypothetical protein [Anaerolineae bacterium]
MAEQTFSPRALIAAALSFVAITVGLTLAIQLIGLERIQAAVEQAGPLAPLLYIAVRA